VIANAGQAAGVLPIPTNWSRTCPPPEGHAHLPAAQRLLAHEESAPRAPGRGCLLSTLHSIPRKGLPTQTREKAHPSSSCTGLTCQLGYWWRFISLLNGVRIVAIDFAVTA
jgi:hypothetical protein